MPVSVFFFLSIHVLSMKILFQGDSITDCGRISSGGAGYETNEVGPGYPGLIKSRLSLDYAEKDLTFINRGISGNRIVDLYARWRADCLNLEPDIISILIGVNDSWHEEKGNGVEPERAERIFRELLSWTRSKLPNARIILLEPFIVPDSDKANLAPEVAIRAAYTKKLAREFNLTFIPLQQPIDEACKRAPSSHWSKDGVHPTPALHQLIADEWLKAVLPL